MRKIKKGDVVQVIAGKDKGRTGKVLQVLTDKWKVVVEGVNIVKKHVKPNPQKEIPGGIVSREAALHISNVSLIDPTKNRPSRVGIKTLENGDKVRYFKSSGEVVDV